MSTSTKPRHVSDPVPYKCTCSSPSEGGQVLLFYRYWANLPTLPVEFSHKSTNPQTLADFHSELAARLALGGKFRLANEGFNITLGGTTSNISQYIEECRNHWSFSGIDLSTAKAQNDYFKPTPGCACAFSGKASIKVTAEITPLGITNYSPSSWQNIISLSPEAFHDLCSEGNISLIDVRNHYESRVGYFVTGKGDIAVRPAVRRFSQWPGYVARHVLGNAVYDQKPIATYCTGGIRCEKGARWMQEALQDQGQRGDAPVYNLHGGIVAYQAWMKEEIESGRKTSGDGLFKGKNYVFDERGAIGSDTEEAGKVARCRGCEKPEDRLGNCKSSGCHLVLVICTECEDGGVACCEDCSGIEMQQDGAGGRRMCKCESEREKSLWGSEGAKLPKKTRQKTR
jgi:predicted sulfurtransferase